ncbi:hypothetical protein PbB2_00358 [Candidatus Phycosocius bacilliformis]|uniref:Uncharacterized protein n=1 Tax=Candidatus Phycosocius bacilliformis TaxID=1445552 RepID=A0A2P2E6K2_9PROT|nr:hypothetical protein [Candidatus Phycosocius bacilliformis]GBF56701.1 hypothetical protein PbB2_00358 [Candidatus Phycosocius bacilliformis]
MLEVSPQTLRAFPQVPCHAAIGFNALNFIGIFSFAAKLMPSKHGKHCRVVSADRQKLPSGFAVRPRARTAQTSPLGSGQAATINRTILR